MNSKRVEFTGDDSVEWSDCQLSGDYQPSHEESLSVYRRAIV